MQDLKESGIGCIDTLNCLQISKGEELSLGQFHSTYKGEQRGRYFLRYLPIMSEHNLGSHVHSSLTQPASHVDS